MLIVALAQILALLVQLKLNNFILVLSENRKNAEVNALAFLLFLDTFPIPFAFLRGKEDRAPAKKKSRASEDARPFSFALDSARSFS